MRCPFCRSENNRVVDSRQQLSTRRRRYECNNCGKRFSTTEYVEVADHAGKYHAPSDKSVKKLKQCYERENYAVATGTSEAFNHCGHAIERNGKDYCPFAGRVPGYFMICANISRFSKG